MSDPYLALQVMMMPRDANPQLTVHPSGLFTSYTTIFGGVLLSYIDQAGAVGARREVIRAGGPPPVVVTVAMNRVEFKKPVLVGDMVRFLTRLVRMGRTSITIHVCVEAERPASAASDRGGHPSSVLPVLAGMAHGVKLVRRKKS